jgi:uncharacterized membrane protein YvbJ
MNQDAKENVKLIDTVLSIIKNDQDYSDEDMLLFKNITISSDEEKVPGKHFVRLSTAEEVYLDFICDNIWTKPVVTETEFDQWPLDFSKY